MKYILAEKINMDQKFAENGTVIPVTVVSAGPCVITQIKTQANDGYSAIQVGFGRKKNIAKPQLGHFKDLGAFAHVMECRITPEEEAQFAVGDVISADVFAAEEIVKVVGTSKGKGFQGVVKRHGFAGQKATHGHKDQLRMPGTSGMGGVQHVFKGKKMGGRMGGDQVTVTNLEIVAVDAAKGLIYIKGAIPGHRGSIVEIVAPGTLTVRKPVAESDNQTVAAPADEPVVAAPVVEAPAEPVVEPTEVATETKPTDESSSAA